MNVIEILAYTPKYMDEFIAFVINGKRKPNGDYETDGEGREITGVIDWLRGRGVKEAHFFNSPKGDDVELFASTVLKPEVYERPWMKQIPGFEVMVKTEGLLGSTSKFAPIGTLLASVKSNADLDKKFVEATQRVAEISKAFQERGSEIPFGEKEFLAALRGDVGSNPKAVFGKIEETFGLKV